MGIYKKRSKIQERNRSRKKERKHALDQENKNQEKKIPVKKKEGRKWKTQIRIKH